MSAPGADAPPAGNGQPPESGQPADPWTGTLESVGEEYRPLIEEPINSLREQLSPRLELADRLEPLGDYAEDLLALANDRDGDGPSALDGVLDFVAMSLAVDPEQPDSPEYQQFAEWWENIGEELGLFDDDGDDPDDGNPEGEPNAETAELRELVGQLQSKIEQLESGGRVQDIRARMEQTRERLFAEHGIKDNEETRKFITRLGQSYVESAETDEQVVELAVADYLKLTGKAQQGLLDGEETETVSATRSPGNGTADFSAEEITTGDPTQSRKRASQIAKQRLQSLGAG